MVPGMRLMVRVWGRGSGWFAEGVRTLSGRSRSAYVGAFSMALSASIGLQSVASVPARAADPGIGRAGPGIALTVEHERPTPTPEPPGTAAPEEIPTPSPVPPTPTDAVVPILYYHRVEPLPMGFDAWSAAQQKSFLQYDVLPVAFAAQLDWLAAHDYTTILPVDLTRHWATGSALPAHPVIISLDDGTHDWMTTVFPLLQRHGMVAEFYTNVRNVYRGALSFDDLRVLAAAGNGIGAHGIDHVQLAGFAGGARPYSDAQTFKEIAGAKAILEREVGVIVDSMAYVGGGLDAALIEMVRAAGYTSARTIIRGTMQHPDQPFELRVVRIGVHDDVVSIRAGILDPGLPTFAAMVRARGQDLTAPPNVTCLPAQQAVTPRSGMSADDVPPGVPDPASTGPACGADAPGLDGTTAP
jgi:peptidoglycan/xylan/chitin deacetylase (PgdA/CDA1 family)